LLVSFPDQVSGVSQQILTIIVGTNVILMTAKGRPARRAIHEDATTYQRR